MPSTITTNNPLGIGYQTGAFTLPTGVNVSEAFAGRFTQDKVYRAAFNCNIIDNCNWSTFLDEFMGVEYSCEASYSTLEYSGFRSKIRVNANTTIPASTSTGTIALSTNDHFVSGEYYLPIKGNTILSPTYTMIDIVSVSHTAPNTTVLTVKQRGTTPIVLTAGTEMYVASGAILSDCECPDGQFRVPDMPIEHDYQMVAYGDKGGLCGDDLLECKTFSIPFYDAQNNEIGDKQAWYVASQRDMYKRMKDRENMERLYNETFGIIPTIQSLGMEFTPADPLAYTMADFREFKTNLRDNGIAENEYMIFADTRRFSKYQQFLQENGVANLSYTERPNNDCAWLNLNWCGFKVENMTFHLVEDCSVGNGIPKDSAIWIPMGDRPVDSSYSFGAPDRRGSLNKKINVVYFRDKAGRTWDLLGDSNGILGPRNSMGTGCDTHEWTVKTRFTQEIHCANQFVFEGL